MARMLADWQDGANVLIATTCYDSPDAAYTFSIAKARAELHERGVKTSYLLLSGNCHVDDARNTVVAEFLGSDCDSLVFIDADVSFGTEDLATLLETPGDILGGVYPYRREGSEEMPVRMLPGIYHEDENGLMEVDGLPTGFMKIERKVLDGLRQKAQRFQKKGQEIPLIFERDLYNGGRRGGDIAFCMKARELGFSCQAIPRLFLGHVGKYHAKDSLSASLRRQTFQTLKHVCDVVRRGEDAPRDIQEVLTYTDNRWSADIDVLSLAIQLARKCTGDILESGSGVSTILMAAANPDVKVWCMEHSPEHACRTERMAREAGVDNIAIVHVPIKDGFYDLSQDRADMPRKFSLGFVDGPPRVLGDRMKFFDVFGDCCTMFLMDDADDNDYSAKLSTWASDHGKVFKLGDCRSAVIMDEAA